MVVARHRGVAARIEVRDSGIGIPLDKQGEIFQEFYQLANPARDRGLGLGLGLAIVARLADLLGTRVHVRSAPARGSVFSLTVPLAEPGAVPHTGGEAIERKGGPAVPVPVLVIDDDPLVLAGNESLLRELGCRVTAVRDGSAAVEALTTLGSDPVLVLCDLWLPDGQSGIAVMQRLQSIGYPPVSGILISGDTRPETIRAAEDAGMILLHKPVAPAKLRAIVDHFASAGRRQHEGNRDEDSSG